MSTKRLILTEWWHGDIVYHKACDDEKGVVAGVSIAPGGAVQYFVKWPSELDGCCHEECELCSEPYSRS
jgi:hypothetical protein